jgi:hypothetical protein
LKNPASAEFSDYSAARLGESRWLSTGEVSSSNSFGAMVKGFYACEMSLDEVLSVSIDY